MRLFPSANNPTQEFLAVYFSSDNADMDVQAPTFEVAHLVRARRLAAPSVDTHAKTLLIPTSLTRVMQIPALEIPASPKTHVLVFV